MRHDRTTARSLPLIVMLSWAAGAQAASEADTITLPSGATAWLQDSINNVPGPAGVTYRYRFVMPDLAKLVPMTTGPATDDLSPEDQQALNELSQEEEIDIRIAPVDDSAAGEVELVDPEDLDLPDFDPADFTDAGAEAAADAAAAGDGGAILPAEPDIMLQDPVHDDIVWLCQNWVLPRLAPPAPLPGQVVISLADRSTTFGEVNMEAVQLFEAFSITPDRTQCVWEVW